MNPTLNVLNSCTIDLVKNMLALILDIQNGRGVILGQATGRWSVIEYTTEIGPMTRIWIGLTTENVYMRGTLVVLLTGNATGSRTETGDSKETSYLAGQELKITPEPG